MYNADKSLKQIIAQKYDVIVELFFKNQTLQGKICDWIPIT